jgi:hypothetical protein
MKRLQIMLDEDLDAELERLSRAQRVSKAALIRRFVRERLHPLPPADEDPLVTVADDDPGWSPMHHDAAVYDG